MTIVRSLGVTTLVALMSAHRSASTQSSLLAPARRRETGSRPHGSPRGLNRQEPPAAKSGPPDDAGAAASRISAGLGCAK